MTESWKGYEGLNLRHVFASLIGKLAAAVVRRTGQGGGTAAPGLVAERLSPAYLYDLLAAIPGGHALISGTNGKTTSAAMVGAMLEKDGRDVVRNISGSNLTRGLLSELLGTTNWRGRLRANAETAGVFEVDEAALVRILPRTRPRAVLLTNLFRDQLDRYGELDAITRRWQAAIGESDGSFTLIANADDPAVVHATESHRGETIFFGVEDGTAGEPDDWADATMCPICGAGLSYDRVNYSHLGHYRCEECRFARPRPRIVARTLESDGLAATEFEVKSDDETISVRLPLPGTYNVYNAVGAMALAGVMGVEGAVMRRALEEFAPAFGRAERVQVGEREVTMLLVKNPAGANEVIRSLAGLEGEQDFLVLLNDKVADGEDVSWIWDVDFSRLRPGSLVVGGRRAADMALRLKYAGLAPARGSVTETNLEKALEGALARGEGPLYVLSTYTALLDFRSLLARGGAVREFWRE